MTVPNTSPCMKLWCRERSVVWGYDLLDLNPSLDKQLSVRLKNGRFNNSSLLSPRLFVR